jgi:hypothetical protein
MILRHLSKSFSDVGLLLNGCGRLLLDGGGGGLFRFQMCVRLIVLNLIR